VLKMADSPVSGPPEEPPAPDQEGEIIPPAPKGGASAQGMTPKAVAVIARLARIDPGSETLRRLTDGLMAAAVEAAAGYARDAISPATQAAYQRDWISFASWCEERDVNPGDLPIDPVVVAAYLASLAKTHGTSALRGRVAAIGYHHRRRGVAFLSTHPVIRETLSGIGRAHGKPVRPAAALTSVEVKRLIATCAEDLRGTRDRALLLVGFAGAFRRSELVGIDFHHLRFEQGGVVIHLPRSKADQEAKGVDVTLPRMRDAVTGAPSETCPVRALETWLRKAKIRRGAVFRAISVHGHLESSLTPRGVHTILRHRASLAKLTVHASERLSPHGLRAGLITEAYLAGAPDEQVAAHTRHGDLSTMRGYRRRARITTDNPARLVDL
jgi:integrase